jgi:hypothetical protein
VEKWQAPWITDLQEKESPKVPRLIAWASGMSLRSGYNLLTGKNATTEQARRILEAEGDKATILEIIKEIKLDYVLNRQAVKWGRTNEGVVVEDAGASNNSGRQESSR